MTLRNLGNKYGRGRISFLETTTYTNLEKCSLNQDLVKYYSILKFNGLLSGRDLLIEGRILAKKLKRKCGNSSSVQNIVQIFTLEHSIDSVYYYLDHGDLKLN